ncbi:MAG: hypothetical protein V7723_07475 [Sneathiella sp.]|uniref:hypothetical protein n=1 Tax=Sneathiella sp. TaxID=1964365 RepID=UPI0030026274
MSDTVNTAKFVDAMRKEWCRFSYTPSKSLEELWGVMSKTFNNQIASFGTPDGEIWKVLTPPTGSGKSTGLAVWCSFLGEPVGFGESPVGVLIVTRLIEQANDITEQINRLAGMTLASAYHSQSNVSREELQNIQVLVITHQAYNNALDKTCKGEEHVWDHLNEWFYGSRQLTVIDEALDVVRHHEVTAQQVRQTIAAIPMNLYGPHATAMDCLKKVADILWEMNAVSETKRVKKGEVASMHLIPDFDMSVLAQQLDLTELISDFKKAMSAGKHWQSQDADNNDRKQSIKLYVKVLVAVEVLVNRLRYYAAKGTLNTINSAELALPDEINGPVLLDATGKQNKVWALFGDKAIIIPTPRDVRSYANVTLHICKDIKGLGKGSMTDRAKDRSANLMAVLGDTVPSSSRVWVCCHKQVESNLVGIEHPFTGFATGHYGAVDGRNDWQDFDTAVIFGLPFRSQTWAANAFLAFKGIPNNEWFKKSKQLRQSFITDQITVSVIQAMNRVRCRRVIDDKGNCEPTSIYIFLPPNTVGSSILEGLKEEMPGVRVKRWKVQLDTQPTTPLKRNDFGSALVAFMGSLGSLKISASDLKREIGISDRQWKRLVATIKDTTSDLYLRLKEINVALIQSGVGRGFQTHLIKTQNH